ncbi:hypothetical protein, partial [Rubrivivax gelatinosus]|uniref:hypothetical protein n=1 Tax=Rubrivivax gelatinosus TaxID=28068 RepID=UPI001ED92E40
ARRRAAMATVAAAPHKGRAARAAERRLAAARWVFAPLIGALPPACRILPAIQKASGGGDEPTGARRALHGRFRIAQRPA